MSRILLKDNITLCREDGSSVKFHIKTHIGSGASCVAYHAVCEDNTEHLLKEYYPRNLELERNEDGVLLVPEHKREMFDKGLQRFRNGNERQKEVRLSENLKNFTSNVQGYFYGNGTEYIDMTVFSGRTYSEVENETLHDLMLRMKTLAQVIGYYHDAGLLHLDIKPDNIFVRPENETIEDVMLFDFDSVIEKSNKMTVSALSYTKDWAAPEQLLPYKRNSICAATDLFSIGEIIFTKIFGRHSTQAERRSFAEYDIDYNADIFKNVNPKVVPLIKELFRHTLCAIPARRYQTAEKLIEQLEEIISTSNPLKQQLLTTCPPAKQHFVGRDTELAKIHELLKFQKTLFLSGLGGIGKSELAKNYALMYTEDYDEIIFATYAGSIMLLINDDAAVRISNFSRSDNSTQAEYYKNKFEKLMDLCTDRTLFIIDNLNSLEFGEDDKVRWTELLKLRCKFLFTTRMQISSFPSLKIGEIANREDKLKLFNEWCEIEDETQMDAAVKIIELVNGHTFTIELIAKQTYNGFSSPVEKLDVLISNRIQNSGFEIVEADKDLAISQGQVIDHICTLFDIAALDDAKQFVLKNASLLPPSGLDARLFFNICAWGDDSADVEHIYETILDDGTLLTPDRVKAEITWLVKNGWVTRNGSIVSVHPVVAEAVVAKLETLDSCSPYLSGVADCLERWEKYPNQSKFQLLNCAQSLVSVLGRVDASAEDVAVVIKMIGQFYCKKQYMMSEALSAFLLSEKKFLESGSANKALLISIKNSIAVVHDYMADITGDNNQRKIAITAHQECLAAYDLINADPIDVAVTWQNLACAYDNSGLSESAEEAFCKAIEIMNGVLRSGGHTERNVSETVTLYTNYAIHYKKIECYEDALTNLNVAFGYASLLGNKTEQVAKLCHDIAAIILLMEGGDLNRALNHAKRSLEIRSEILLPDSYYLAMSKYVLARCYIAVNKNLYFSQSIQLLTEAVAIFQRVLGEKHPSTQQLQQTIDEMQA